MFTVDVKQQQQDSYTTHGIKWLENNYLFENNLKFLLKEFQFIMSLKS